VVFEFTADTAGRYLFWLNPDQTDFNSVLYATSTCGETSTSCLAADDDETDGGEALILNLNVGQTIYVTVDGWSPVIQVAGNFQLEVSFLGPAEVSCLDNVDNDGDSLTDCDDADCAGVSICPDLGTTCATAVMINSVPSTFYGSTFGGENQLQADAGACAGFSQGGGTTAPEVKIRFIAPESSIYRVYLDPLATEYDTALYALSGCNNLANCLGGADAAGLGGDELLLPIAEGMEVVFVVDGSTHDLALQGEFLLHLESTGPKEIICDDQIDGDDDGMTDCADDDCSDAANCPKPGDECASAKEIPALPVNLLGSIDQRSNTSSLSEDCSELSAGAGSAGVDSIYRWVADQTGIYLAVLPFGLQDFDSILYVLSGCDQATCLGASYVSNIGGEVVQFTAKAGDERYIVIDSVGSAPSGNYLLAVFFVTPSEVDCQDGLDDDNDGDTDCSDDECITDPNCL